LTGKGNQAVVQAQLDIYTCPSDLRAGKLIAPQTYAPGGGGSVGTVQFRASTYRVMSGQQDPSSTDTFCGFYYEVNTARTVFPLLQGAFHGDGMNGLRGEKLTDITDGTSNTLFVGERMIVDDDFFGRGSFWGDSFNLYNAGASYVDNAILEENFDTCDLKYGAATTASNYCKYGWGSIHPGGIQFLFGDGGVRPIQKTISMKIFEALSTIHGGEVVGQY
jgi:prepilin-type processing-associated H-X9-DG protein